MTFIAAFHSRETIWMVADRRLTSRKVVKTDQARKLLFLNAHDGQAIFGYAGLGSTAKGTEPSDWMSRVLRGRDMSVEQSILAIAAAMKAEMPGHLRHTAKDGQASHMVVVAAFVAARPRTYTIDLAVAPDGTPLGLKCENWLPKPNLDLPPRVLLTGSGAQWANLSKKAWTRPLLRLAKSHDNGKLSALAVADALAALAYSVHSLDRFTGPHSIVAWRRRRVARKGGGGAHAFYKNGLRAPSNASLPSITHGTDMAAFLGKVVPHMAAEATALLKGLPVPDLDVAALEAELARLPNLPDEKLD